MLGNQVVEHRRVGRVTHAAHALEDERVYGAELGLGERSGCLLVRRGHVRARKAGRGEPAYRGLEQVGWHVTRDVRPVQLPRGESRVLQSGRERIPYGLTEQRYESGGARDHP